MRTKLKEEPMRGRAVLYRHYILYSTVQYSTVQYSTVLYSTVQYSTVQYSTVLYSTVPNYVLCKGRMQDSAV